jgi:hypothetical protein
MRGKTVGTVSMFCTENSTMQRIKRELNQSTGRGMHGVMELSVQ